MAGSVPKTEQGLRGIAADDRSMDLRRHDCPDAKAVSSPQCFLDTLLELAVPEAMVPDVRDHVVENGGLVRFVHLVCELAENERRLASPERARFKKMTSADTFNRF